MAAESPLPRPASSRLAGLDAAKGLAIACVVLIHAAPVESGLYDRHVVSGVTRLAVPIFLVVTGFLAGSKGTARRRFRDYFVKFLGLHLVYGAFYWGVEILREGRIGPLTTKSVLLHFAEASYPGQYYFVILVQLFLVASLVPKRLWRSPTVLVASAASALAGWFLLSATLGEPPWESLPLRIAWRALTTPNGLWLWLYFFALGSFLGARSASGSVLSTRSAVGLVAAGIVVATVGLPNLPDWGAPPRFPYARLPIYTGATLVALALPALATRSAPRLLAILGENSFAIFVLNPALLSVLGAGFGWAQTPPLSWLYAALTLAAALPLAALLRRRAPFLLA